MSAFDRVRLTEAIAKLAVARGARAEDEELEIYVEGLQDMTTDLVVQACRVLWNAPKAPYEQALPPIATIRQRVSVLSHEAFEAARHARLASPPAVPLTEEEAAERQARGGAMRDKFLADLRAMIQSKQMPS